MRARTAFFLRAGRYGKYLKAECPFGDEYSRTEVEGGSPNVTSDKMTLPRITDEKVSIFRV